ncbi:hypothetical protein AKJ09_00632 [Labilithrix luteola]|uniref:Uncharacterized protein n=1 Tax=Labilithrix luteola TaxID=1391654 RepID=A0A0K1PKA1_9BACT|nr:hypothetical protein [Labilithrix luteola]AKU93968.1 hypothetical protein AKJ09_00632 [Labilithrix luteola]
MNCALPTTCSACQSRRFVYVPSWRTSYGGRRPESHSETEPFWSNQAAADNRMLMAMPVPPESVWQPPRQYNVPLSLRICANCGAAQPFVDPTTLQALVDASGGQAVYVDHDTPTGPYRT